MRHRPATVLLASCFFAWPAIPVEAGCDTCAWSDRGDRWEGVDSKQISGAGFKLLGVHNRRRSAAASDSGQIHLTFWLPEARELDQIEVWQPARLYRMAPAEKRYGGGGQEFAWPRGEVLDRLGLSIESLYTRIRTGSVYFPALLSTGERPAPAAGYAFVFQSGAGIAADCTIARCAEPAALARCEEPARVVRSFKCYEAYGGTLVIEWDGLDDDRQPVAAGVYVLKLMGTMKAQTWRPLRRSVAFWHRAPPESMAGDGESKLPGSSEPYEPVADPDSGRGRGGP